LLIQADLDLWMRNPIFGVGPGLATEHRKEFFQALPAHCEVTRLLAEHGLFGFAALILLATALVKRLLAIRDPQFRSLAVACSAFGVLCMISNAMRVAAPGFLIGVAFASEYVAPRRPDHRQPALR
jgi:O-antigen ligase